jgi:hypothetical protein
MEADLHAREVDHRKALLQLASAKLLDRQLELAMDRHRTLEIIVAHVREKDHTAIDEDRQAGDGAQRLPLRQTVPRHARVDRVAAIAGAGQAGFAPGRRAAVRRAMGIDQSDLMPELLEVMRGPGAEHPGADHDDALAPSRLCHCLGSTCQNGSAARPGEERAAR